MNQDLEIIKACLDEALSLQGNPSLIKVLEDLKVQGTRSPLFSNYRPGSRSLAESPERIKELDLYYREAPLLPCSWNDLLSFNGQVIGGASGFRDFTVESESSRFPHHSQIEKGCRTLDIFMHRADISLFLRLVAFLQGFVSLHPFQDGHGRTARLILDKNLDHLGLPTTRIEPPINDLHLSNNAIEKRVSLADAIEKVIQAML